VSTPDLPPAIPVADDKDWTWVLTEPCSECGFDAGTVSGADVAGLVLDSLPRWQQVLARPDSAVRTWPEVWSPLEYACHVRDVFTIFGQRANLILNRDDPLFANWDQDATALEQRYWEQQPAIVAAELSAAGADVAAVFGAVTADQWDRVGRRSNGSVFTVDTLGRYFIHDVVHHLGDVRG
jgi:hypothetical protein